VDPSLYLCRIGYSGPRDPTPEVLRRIHRAHLFTVPFENLDIHLKRPIVLDEERILDKIVRQHRGGFCYELNGGFAVLLRSLNFHVTQLSAGVARADGSFGPDFDHMTLLVETPEPWLCDVGFGDCFLEPLPLVPDVEFHQQGFGYRSFQIGSHWLLQRREQNGEWKSLYKFTLIPRQLSDYVPMCHYQQTSPESHFTRQRICSRATPEGRLTLSDLRFIVTQSGRRTETELSGEEEYRKALKEHFAIDLGDAEFVAPKFAESKTGRGG